MFKYIEENKIQPGIKVRLNSIISTKNFSIRNKEVRSQTKDFPSMEEEKKIWKKMDCRDSIFIHKENVRGIYFCDPVSTHGER